MKFYVVYDEQGNILRSGSCQNHMLEAQASRPGERVVEGKGDDANHVVVPLGQDVAVVPKEFAVLDGQAWRENGSADPTVVSD